MDPKKFEEALRPLKQEPLLGSPREPELAAMLEMFFPECEVGADGYPAFLPDDKEKLNTLFERFGLRLRVEHNTLNVLVEAYQFCTIYMGDFVNRAVRRPDAFEYMTREWPDVWKNYALAIARGKREDAKALATKLMPLAPDCPYPPLLRPYRDNGVATPRVTKSQPPE